MKILVTGANGMLGTDLCALFRANNIEVIEWDLPGNDITDVKRTTSQIKRLSPDQIVHLAAYTDVDGCEVAKAKAYSVNVQGTWAVVIGAKEKNIPVLHISTDYVFDGEKEKPYLEDDVTYPINYYGLTKVQSEEIVKSKLKKFFIVRTSWLFGKSGKNFIKTILNTAKEKETIEVVKDQKGSPTYTKDLAQAILKVVQSDFFGIYHITNSGVCSWFEFAQEIIKQAGLNNKVNAITSDQSKRAAKRPKFSALNNHNYIKIFGTFLRPWREALAQYLKESE
jgi:dTDP-4-dehydrorhamnose reductase